MGPKGPVLAYSDPSGAGPMVVTSNEKNTGPGAPQAIDGGGGGYGISLALDKDGNPHVAYYTRDGEVRHAHSIGGSPWAIR